MRSFLGEYWGFDPHDWAVKYWNAINAYNREYQGITVEDFVECWILFDEAGMDFFAPAIVNQASPYRYRDIDVKRAHAANYNSLVTDVVKDIREHWRKKPH